MLIWGALLLATLIMKLWPETLSAQWLHRHLVDLPLAHAERVERRHIIFLFIMLCLLASVETLAMLMTADIASTAFALDLATYFDAVAALWTISMMNRTRGALSVLSSRLHRVLPARWRGTARARSRRAAARRAVAQCADNDDDHSAAIALAA